MKLRGSAWILGSAIALGAFGMIAACGNDDASVPDLQFDSGLNLSDGSSGGNGGDGQVTVDGNVNPGHDSGQPGDDSGTDAGDAAPDVHVPAACNDGKVDMGETCDPLASCPVDCAPQGCNIRTLDNAGTCTAACSVVAVQSVCQNGDGCCPPGCNAITDNDCTASCGNGVKEAGEKCDGADCPTKCDSIGCSAFKLQGSDCQRECVADPGSDITACTVGDKCCPSTCTIATDADCAISCGNGKVDDKLGETCDTGIASGQGACPTTCASQACQTYTLKNGGTCTAACVADAPITACKNGDGCCPSGCDNTNDGDCTPVCGNGVVESGEKCDTKLPNSCPTAADCGQKVCQLFTLVDEGKCTAECKPSGTQASCINSDGCCPPGCTNLNDNDCAVTVTCGDGKFDPATETCDDSTPDHKCPTCPTVTSCTQNTGSASTCNLKCTQPTGSCINGDKCCPYGKTNATCNSKVDDDCKGTSWLAIATTPATLKPGACVTIEVTGIQQGGSYDVTTCTPKDSPATGDMDLEVSQFNSRIGTPIGSNDVCPASSVPFRAGYTCTNKAAAVTGACVSGTTGGFLARGSGNLSIKVCATAAGSAQGPITLFYNADTTPSFVPVK